MAQNQIENSVEYNSVEYTIVNIEVPKLDHNNEVQTIEGIDSIVYCLRINEDELEYNMTVGLSQRITQPRPDYLKSKKFKTCSSFITGLKEILIHHRMIIISMEHNNDNKQLDLGTHHPNSENIDDIAKLIVSELKRGTLVKPPIVVESPQIEEKSIDRKLINGIPKDALEVVKSFVQDVRKPLFFTVYVYGEYHNLRVSLYKGKFKVDVIDPDNEIDNKSTRGNFPIYFNTKKALATFIHNHQDPEPQAEFEEEEDDSHIYIKLNNKTICQTKICLSNKDYRERKTLIREAVEDFADMILEGHN